MLQPPRPGNNPPPRWRVLTAAGLFAIMAMTAGPFVNSSATAAPEGAASQNPARILYISSYHPAFPTFFDQIAGFKAGLEENGFDGRQYQLDIEFLDSKRFPIAERAKSLEEDLKKKFARLKPYDLVVTADDNALRFAIDRQDTLFSGLNIVFLGVNNTKLAIEQNQNPRIVGVIEKRSSGETLQLAHRLFPQADAIHIITDSHTPTGKANLRALTKTLNEWSMIGPVAMDDLAENSYETLFRQLSELPPSTPLFIGGVYRDKMGQRMEFGEFLSRLRKNFKGPIFASQAHGIGDGVLGGLIVSHFEQGKTAAGLSARILRGEPSAALRVVTESPNIYMFDYEQLGKFGVSVEQLPARSTLINRPRTILDDYAHWVVGGGVALLIQLILILALMNILDRRREAAAALRDAAEHAKAANHAKSAFLSNMSHEFRTPLNSIIGFSDLIKNEVMGPLENGKYKEFATDINTSGEHLLKLVNGILDLSKIEVGEMSLLETTMESRLLTMDCIKVIEPLAEAARVGLAHDLMQDVHVIADETKIKQILINLLGNAIKFTPPLGTVDIKTGFDDQGCFQMIVRDTGIGMTADEIKVSLSLFGQVEDHLTKTREGTGLGLPLANKLVELHGGVLTVESEKHIGTTITVTLPASRVAQRETRAA